MAAKVVAQLIIHGTSILSRAFFSAYQQALRNAKQGGATGATAARAVGKFKMQPDEAAKILNVDVSAALLTRESLQEHYLKHYAANDPAKGGSFYLQSKIFRAKESLEHDLFGPAAPTETEEKEQSDDSSAESTSDSDQSKKEKSGS